jgi:hypothetical protein
MTPQQIEDLYIRSFDHPMTAQEKEILLSATKANAGLASDLSHYKKIREVALRGTAAGFGPYFAKKVITRIQNVGIQIDRLVLVFFKKYQVAALGAVVALLALNAAFADQLDLLTLFGLEDAPSASEEVVLFDFNEILNIDL